MRSLLSLTTGVASLILSFMPLAGIILGIVAIGAGGPLREDRRAVIGMLCGLAGIVLAMVFAAATLETAVVN